MVAIDHGLVDQASAIFSQARKPPVRTQLTITQDLRIHVANTVDTTKFDDAILGAALKARLRCALVRYSCSDDIKRAVFPGIVDAPLQAYVQLQLKRQALYLGRLSQYGQLNVLPAALITQILSVGRPMV